MKKAAPFLRRPGNSSNSCSTDEDITAPASKQDANRVLFAKTEFDLAIEHTTRRLNRFRAEHFNNPTPETKEHYYQALEAYHHAQRLAKGFANG